MNPLEIFTVILPIIEEIPSLEGSVSALIKAVEGMFKGGSDPLDVVKTVIGLVPAISNAVVANTTHSASTVAPAAVAAVAVAAALPATSVTGTADALNAAEAQGQVGTGS